MYNKAMACEVVVGGVRDVNKASHYVCHPSRPEENEIPSPIC